MNGIPMTHPEWVAIGLAMILIGIWLIRWANRNSMSAEIAAATADAAIGALKKRSGSETPNGKPPKVVTYSFRHAMSQVFGVAGFIMVIAGLLLAIFGAFLA